MPQIDLASWSSPSRALCPSGAQQRGLSMATASGAFAMTRSTTCRHVKRPWRARTRRSSMTATSKPFRFPPTSTPIHTATAHSMPDPNATRRAGAENAAGPGSHAQAAATARPGAAAARYPSQSRSARTTVHPSPHHRGPARRRCEGTAGSRSGRAAPPADPGTHQPGVADDRQRDAGQLANGGRTATGGWLTLPNTRRAADPDVAQARHGAYLREVPGRR